MDLPRSASSNLLLRQPRFYVAWELQVHRRPPMLNPSTIMHPSCTIAAAHRSHKVGRVRLRQINLETSPSLGNCTVLEISDLKLIAMSDRENNGSASSLSNQSGRLQPENESGTSDNAEEDYADEIFRGASGVDETTSFDDMPPRENYHGPIVIIPPITRDLSVHD